MSTIITRNSATSGSIPSSLVQGELAINVTDGKLFYGSGSGNVVKEFGTTASYALNALSASYYDEKDPIFVAKSASLATTGSNIFIGNQTVTGSLFTTGSNTLIGNTSLTGSLSISGSTVQKGNNTLLGNTVLSGSIVISSSLAPGNLSASVNIFGDTAVSGFIRFNPYSTNIDPTISASYIYVSGSTNDLYFSQNGKGYSNTTRLRWLEGNLYTGLLSGGLISSASSTTFNISSGSGIIVNLNASVNDDPFPTVQYVNWGNLTNQPLPYLTSSIQTFVGIDGSGNIIQQIDPWNDGQYNTSLSIGTVLHQNTASINSYITYPNVAYGWKQRSYDFIKAFGSLKLSGYTIYTSSSLGLTVGSGTAWSDGRNYQTDPNNPSYITDSGTNVSKIFRYYVSGSTPIQDTNGGIGYPTIDPSLYNNNGILTSILPATPWSNQRVFYYPNSATKGIVVYYGNKTYASSTEAIANLQYENFQETPNTQQNAIYLGTITIKYNGTFTAPNDYVILPGGIFRNVGGSGGGGAVTSTLAGLSDVSIVGPTNGQPLVYNSASLKWENQSTLTANLIGNASTATTASYAATASFITASNVYGPFGSNSILTASYALNSSTSSYATTAANILVLVKNQSGNNIAKGVVVRITGSNTSSDIPRIITASYENDNNSANTLGITYESIANGSEGYVITEGVLLGVDTTNFISGQLIYLGATGSIIGYAPQAPLHAVRLGEVVRQQSNNGSIYVRIDNGYEIEELHDVLITSASSGDLLIRSASVWINSKQLSGSYGLTGSLTATSFTGSLFGTSSWANNAQTSQTASYVLNAISASYAQTASYAPLYLPLTGGTINGNIIVNGTASIAFLNVSYESASVIYSSGSNQFGDASNDVQTLWGTVDVKTGPVLVTGSLQVQNSIDSSLRFLFDSTGTSSLDWEDGYLYNGSGSISVNWRDRKLYDSNVDNSVNWNSRELFKSDGTTVTLNWETGAFTGSMLGTASYATQALSSSYALTASYVQNAQTASYVLQAVSASYATQALSSSFATTASYIQTAQTASYVLNAVSASYATTASYVQIAQTASYVLNAVSASFATTSSYVNPLRQTVQITGSLNVTGSVYINNALYSNQTTTLATENKVVYSVPTATYNAIFVDYVVINGSNVRAGQIVSATDGSDKTYTETTTTDIGSTTPVTFNVSISGGNIQLEVSASTSTWTVKTTTRVL